MLSRPRALTTPCSHDPVRLFACLPSAQDVVDTSGVSVCGITWADGCGDATPPDGFKPESTVAELCSKACAFYAMQQLEAEKAKAESASNSASNSASS